MAKKKEQGQRANEELRLELPPGVKLLHTLEGHQGGVNSVAFDPQGETLASGSNEGRRDRPTGYRGPSGRTNHHARHTQGGALGLRISALQAGEAAVLAAYPDWGALRARKDNKDLKDRTMIPNPCCPCSP
ncbi:MAG TPA: WD40 repeat domain-containing protein [Thermoanaerobaculia bacterium]|nr:WD40 repeat domain-containing protein [Thermoanaerobaculia bacterium]